MMTILRSPVFLSRYKNLTHTTYTKTPLRSLDFLDGMRRRRGATFFSNSVVSDESFRTPSIGDIELGYGCAPEAIA